MIVRKRLMYCLYCLFLPDPVLRDACILVDLVTLAALSDAFAQHAANSEKIGVLQLIGCLTTVFESLEKQHAALVNVPLCVDMTLNWLLNVYDM